MNLGQIINRATPAGGSGKVRARRCGRPPRRGASHHLAVPRESSRVNPTHTAWRTCEHRYVYSTPERGGRARSPSALLRAGSPLRCASVGMTSIIIAFGYVGGSAEAAGDDGICSSSVKTPARNGGTRVSNGQTRASNDITRASNGITRASFDLARSGSDGVVARGAGFLSDEAAAARAGLYYRTVIPGHCASGANRQSAIVSRRSFCHLFTFSPCRRVSYRAREFMPA
jgi:hypothetical protein